MKEKGFQYKELSILGPIIKSSILSVFFNQDKGNLAVLIGCHMEIMAVCRP